MIGSLKGIVEIIDTSSLIVDVNGVGYKVLVSPIFENEDKKTFIGSVKDTYVPEKETPQNDYEDYEDYYENYFDYD